MPHFISSATGLSALFKLLGWERPKLNERELSNNSYRNGEKIQKRTPLGHFTLPYVSARLDKTFA